MTKRDKATAAVKMYVEKLLSISEIVEGLNCSRGGAASPLNKGEISLSPRQEEIAKLVRIRRGERLLVDEIAKELGVTRQTVILSLKKSGITPPTRQDKTEAVIKMYVEERLSVSEIANAFGCTRPSIEYHLNKSGVQRTPRPSKNKQWSQPESASSLTHGMPVRLRTIKTTYRINDSFFCQWSPEMAWVLGLIFTDGCLSKDGYSVTLTSVDIDVLEKVKAVLGYDGPISQVNKNSKAHRITISRKKIYEDLKRFGLTPNKSLTLIWPSIPRPFMRHFLRGVFEGDGCFHWGKNGVMCVSLVSGSDTFLDGVATEIRNMDAFSKRGYSLAKHKIQTAKSSWTQLSFTARYAVEEFYWMLYESVPEHLCMTRKRRAMEEYLNNTLPNRLDVQPAPVLAMAA